MKHKILFSFCLIFSWYLFVNFILKTSGGHPSSTGAPGEQTCAQSGCHADAYVGSGTDINILQFGNPGNSTYSPGSVYNIQLWAIKPGHKKFGFQIVALKNSNNGNTGTWTITDADRTHIISGSGSLSSRKYVTHSTNGTPEFEPGTGYWTFNWTAPSTDVGAITFYYSTNITNNNGENTGDSIMLSSYTIFPMSTAATEIQQNPWKVYSAGKTIVINYPEDVSKLNCNIISSDGKIIERHRINGISQSLNSATIQTKVKAGFYFVELESGSFSIVQKLFIVE